MSEIFAPGSQTWGYNVRSQVPNRTLNFLRSSNSGMCWTTCLSNSMKLRSSTFVDGRWDVLGFKRAVNSFKVSRVRSAIGRRHHKRREEEFKAHLRFQEKSLEPNAVQFQKTDRVKSDSESLVITFDVDKVKQRVTAAVTDASQTADRLFGVARSSAKRSLDGAVHLAKSAAEESHEVWRDLSTSVSVQRDRNFVISVRLPPILLAAKIVLGCILLVFLPKLLMNAMRTSWWWSERHSQSDRVVRDRSLAGKEIPVTKREPWEPIPVRRSPKLTPSSRGPLDIPLQSNTRSEKELVKSPQAQRASQATHKKSSQLPGWWPGPDLPPSTSSASRQKAEEQANRLVQGIMQKRLSGLDFNPADILQLRQLCKSAGAQVKFDTNNTRDSFYRAAISLVLSACQSPGRWSASELGSEGGIRFIAGLADSIALESQWAATMVAAAIAARTRAGLLQAIALHLQSKVMESDEELLKLIRLHDSFPVDPNSAELEMVAQGLGSHFDEQGRFELLHAYERLGGSKTKRIAEAALGLLPLPDR